MLGGQKIQHIIVAPTALYFLSIASQNTKSQSPLFYFILFRESFTSLTIKLTLSSKVCCQSQMFDRWDLLQMRLVTNCTHIADHRQLQLSRVLKTTRPSPTGGTNHPQIYCPGKICS